MMRLQRTWPYLVLVAGATILMIALKFPLSRLDVPYTFEGDALDKLAQIQTVAETGWLFHNDRLGFPFGYDRLDFPRFDSLNYVILGPLAALTGQPGLALNLYYLASFYLIAFTAYFSLRKLGIAPIPALPCALLYAFLPYHVLRGVSHLTNGAYFLVPLAMLVLVLLARDRIGGASKETRRNAFLAFAVALLLPLQMPYNGFFFAYLTVVAGTIALARRASRRTLLAMCLLLATTAGAFAVEQIPVFVHALQYGSGAQGFTRNPAAAQEYALQLNQVLLPTSRDRRMSVVAAKHGFEQAMDVAPTEVRDQYIGVLGIVGLFALAWSLCRAIVRSDGALEVDETEAAARILALLLIAILLLAIPSGLDTLIAYWITDNIRAYNRILPFFAFGCTVGAGWALQALMQRIGVARLGIVVVCVIGVIALGDILVRPPFGTRTAPIADYDASRAYFRRVEHQLGDHASVFQLPVVWYPENPAVNAMNDYEEFEPFFFTKTLRFSYGASRARRGYGWGKSVEGLSAKAMIARLHAMGFAAILIDARAYTQDSREALTTALRDALPEDAIVSNDRRWWTFPLKGCCDASATMTEHPKEIARAVFDYAPDEGPLRFDSAGSGVLYTVSGWLPPEDWGIWQSGSDALLRMRIVPVPAGPITLTLDTNMMLGPKITERHLHIECNGQGVSDTIFTLSEPSHHLEITIPRDLIGANGMLELRFAADPKASPASAGVSEDARLLGVGLVSLSISPAGDAR